MNVEIDTKNIGDNHVVIPARAGDGGRIGIYARGGCHLRALFACAPLIEPVLRGTCCIYHDGQVSDARTDQQLQILEGFPRQWLEPVIEKFRLGPDYFTARLFEKDFAVPGRDDLGRFPKTAIIYSVASDAVGRKLYRHRQHGFLFDPGAGWLRGVDHFLNDPAAVAWFRQQFEPIGMMSVEAFVENFTRLVRSLRARTGAHVVAMNVLSLEPGNTTHNYQSVKHSDTMRWRQFNIALAELSRQLDFPVLDQDRVVRRAGMRGQMAAAHFPPAVNLLIAREAFRILKDGGIF